MRRVATTLLSLGLLAASAAAEPACTEPTENEWLSSESFAGIGTAVDPTLVHTVLHDIDKAVAELDKEPALALSASDVTQLLGSAVSAPAGLEPYLVRAVFPTPAPSLAIAWHRDVLEVNARGLGCAPFVKHPVIVYLDRKPQGVVVRAGAAL